MSDLAVRPRTLRRGALNLPLHRPTIRHNSEASLTAQAVNCNQSNVNNSVTVRTMFVTMFGMLSMTLGVETGFELFTLPSDTSA